MPNAVVAATALEADLPVACVDDDFFEAMGCRIASPRMTPMTFLDSRICQNQDCRTASLFEGLRDEGMYRMRDSRRGS